MLVAENHEKNISTLIVDGNIDENSSLELEEKVLLALENKIETLVFNFKKVNYISSTGIRVLIVAYKKARKKNISVVINEISKKAEEILDTVGVLPLFCNREENLL